MSERPAWNRRAAGAALVLLLGLALPARGQQPVHAGGSRTFTVRCGRAYESMAHARQGNWVGLRPAQAAGDPFVRVADHTPVDLTFPLAGVPRAFSYVIRVEYRGWLFQYCDEHQLSPSVDDIDLRPFNLTYAGLNPVGVAGLAILALAVLGSVGMVVRRSRRIQAENRLASVALEEVKAGGGGLMLATIGRYRLVQRLGEGGQAVVYKGLPSDTMDTAEPVAIKLIKEEHAANPDFRRRFQREVKACFRLSHPSILRIIDWGEEGDRLFMVTELIEGVTLQRHLRPGGLPVNRAMKVLEAILEAVGHAHQRGIVHRDLKPANVMVTPQDAIKVMDFGLAGGRDLTQVTVTGQLFGTLAYVAPERIRDHRCLDPRSDQYAIGLMAYELFVGRLPFDEDLGAAEILARHLSGAFPSLRGFRPDLPPGLDAVVRRMVATNPDERYASAEEALAALQSAHHQSSEFGEDLEETGDFGPVAGELLGKTEPAGGG